MFETTFLTVDIAILPFFKMVLREFEDSIIFIK